MVSASIPTVSLPTVYCLLPTDLQCELEANKHSKGTRLALIGNLFQVRQSVDEVYTDKFKDVLNAITHFNIRSSVRKKSNRHDLLTGSLIRDWGDQVSVHLAHAAKDYVGRSHQTPL